MDSVTQQELDRIFSTGVSIDVPAGSLVVVVGEDAKFRQQWSMELAKDMKAMTPAEVLFCGDVIVSDAKHFAESIDPFFQKGASVVLSCQYPGKQLIDKATIVLLVGPNHRPTLVKRPVLVTTEITPEFILIEPMTPERFVAELINVTEERDWFGEFDELQSRLESAYAGFRTTLPDLNRAHKLKDLDFKYDSARNPGLQVWFKGKICADKYDTKFGAQYEERS
jgi:hypothetical protein